MSSTPARLSQRDRLAIAATVYLIALLGAAVLNTMTPGADLIGHTQKRSVGHGVQVTTTLGTRQAGRVIDVVAYVSVVNNGDQPVAYVGFPCSDPVSVEFRSTLADPPGPAYSTSAMALLAKVMEYRHSLDRSLSFTDESTDATSAHATGCEDSAPPMLPPHQRLAYSLTSPLVIDGTPYVDAPTTDVVTTLQLGDLPQVGQPPAPIQPTHRIEVRTPLQQVASYRADSRAAVVTASQRFDEAMKNPELSAWVDTQDPSSWREARLADSFTAGVRWTLTAFNRGYAVPLVATGWIGNTVSVRVPQEKASQPSVAEALIPSGSVSRSHTYVPWRDLYVGDLVLPTGKIMVGDPVSSDGMLTFDLGLPAGSYPVHVVTGRPRYLGQDWERVAWEALVVSNLPVTHWAPAVPVGHSIKELKPGEAFIWGTDGGTSVFE